MNLLKIIIFIGCALQLVHCGGQGSSEREIKVARVENGVPKAEDGRVILSSEAESLTIPEGRYKGQVISKQKLEDAIAHQLRDVSEVFVYSFESTPLVDTSLFTVKLSVQSTASGFVYAGVECASKEEDYGLILQDCASNQVRLDRKIQIPLGAILI